MKPVLCFGDVCSDLIIPYGDAILAQRGKIIDPELLSVQALCGGSIGNTAVAIARQKVPVMFCGTVGNDGAGRMLYDDLINEGVDVSLMNKSEACSTVLILIVLDEHGDRHTFAYPKHGASQHQIFSEQIPHDITKRISWLHSTGMTLRENPAAEVQLDLMRRCYEAGIPVSLDINARVEALGEPLFIDNIRRAIPYCSVILGSAKDEIIPLTDYNDEALAAKALQGTNRIIVARHGENGATVYFDNSCSLAPAYSVSVVDTVGAGDAYNAGFICAMLKGRDAKDANRLACATASYSVAHKGGHAAPNCEQLSAFLTQNS